jgi:hypothetical protein
MPAPSSPCVVMARTFRRSMVEIYRTSPATCRTTACRWSCSPIKDPAVWADLGMILWAAGLKATAAWTISTETEAAGIKKGNYVQGTVCLVLRKRTASEPGFLDEVYPLVEDEVKRQIASMQALDEDGEPNFNDADYQLAAYAAALKVLTQYGNLDGKDVEHEVFRRARQEREKRLPDRHRARSWHRLRYPRPARAGRFLARAVARRALLPPGAGHREPGRAPQGHV